MTTPVRRGLEELLARLNGVREVGPRRWKAICPSHEDRNPSLSIRLGTEGRVLLHCFASCRTEDVLRALQLDWSSLFANDTRPPRPPRTGRETEWQRARRMVLERERLHAKRRVGWLPFWLANDVVRHCAKTAAAARAVAPTLGPDTARVWPLLERAARVETAGLAAEAELDALFDVGRLRLGDDDVDQVLARVAARSL